ncbi:MAG: methylated-DNA--[protein]-cysteine S-methyltransferase [Candidatus Cloacimonetes bacterium]|nr:methylated-DNA--[protein]-cysteine S-methyltransferase [Candidatus Cloacimonadota bacterium]
MDNSTLLYLYYNQSGFHIMLTLLSETVTVIDFLDKDSPQSQEPTSAHPYIDRLDAYLHGRIKELDLPYRLNATPFVTKVYDATKAIPRGQTASYGEIAALAGSPKAARAVGAAMASNPLPLIIPCHRVVGASGKLTGFGGGLDLKERLLNLEKDT